MGGVFLGKMGPLLRQVIQCEDGRNRAGRHACAAVDALDGIDEELIGLGVPSSSFLGWMQSTGQASTQALSLVPIQGSAMTYAISALSDELRRPRFCVPH